jgi:hypothetical protein
MPANSSKRIFQRAQGFHVQVVGGFVQQQHVAAGDQGFGQVQAAAFTAGQHADLLLLVATVEVEAAAVGAAGHLELADGEDVEAAGNVFPNGLVVGQVVAVSGRQRPSSRSGRS